MPFRYCEKLFTELYFFGTPLSGERTISPCCSEVSIDYPVFLCNEIFFDIHAYKKFIESVLFELQTETTLCRECPDLVYCDNDPTKYRHKFSITHFQFSTNIGYCNCRCTYCAQDLSMRGSTGYPAMPLLNNLLKENILAKDCRMSWGGGEPTFAPDFSEVCAELRKNGTYQEFFTNSTLFSQEIALTLRENKGLVLTSLDAGTRETYRKVKGIDAFSAVVRNLRAYANENPDALILKYLVTDENADRDEMDAFFDLCEEITEKPRIACSCDGYGYKYDVKRVGSKVIDAMDYFTMQMETRDFILSSYRWIPLTVEEELKQRSLARLWPEIKQKAISLEGKEAVFWGGGQAYEQYKHLFAEVRAHAFLQTITPDVGLREYDGIPLMHPDEYFTGNSKFSFVVFCRRENREMFEKNIKSYLHRCNEDIVWCLI
ncbi:MAG: hypothetical protein DELT_02654 [Desulfovibrio sp.]